MPNPSNLYHSGDISGNLRIRTADQLTHGKKLPLKKYWKFYFGLKHPKMATLKGGFVRLQVSLSSSQCALLLPKNALLFLELPFYFPEVPFFSWNFSFVFQKCSFMFQKCLFISQKFAIVFDICPLIFQKCLLFICCAGLFPSMSVCFFCSL